MDALKILVSVHGLVDDALRDPTNRGPATLFALLEHPTDDEVLSSALDVLSLLSPKSSFADAVVAQDQSHAILGLLRRPTRTQGQERGWAILDSLAEFPSVANALVRTAAWIQLLAVLVAHDGFPTSPMARQGAARVLARLLWEPKTGFVLAPLLRAFLPEDLFLALKDQGPNGVIRTLDEDSETPYLVWNSHMRLQLRAELARHLDDLPKDPSAPFHLPPNYVVEYHYLKDEWLVGGIFIRRFLKEPTVPLRNPLPFLQALMERWDAEIEALLSPLATPDPPDSGVLEPLTTAVVRLCELHSPLCDELAQWVPTAVSRLRSSLEAPRRTVLISSVRILHVASSRRVNVEALAGRKGEAPVVGALLGAMRVDSLHPDAGFLLETLARIFLDALGDLDPSALPAMPSASPPVAPSNSGDSGASEDPVTRARREYERGLTSPRHRDVLVPRFDPLPPVAPPGAPGCAHARAALLSAALEADLAGELIRALEHPDPERVRDPPAVRRHAVGLLRALSGDPGRGTEFARALADLPGWSEYEGDV